MSTYVSCPSWTVINGSQTPCEVVQEVYEACTGTYTTIFPPYVEEAFIPSGSNVTACTCCGASYNLVSACMFCASSSPSLVSWNEWTANCPTNLTSTIMPSDAGVILPLNIAIPCYADYDPQSWPNETFNEETASSIGPSKAPNLNLTSCATIVSVAPSASSTKTPMGAIAGGVVGGVFLLLLVCGGIVFAIRRRRRRIPKSSPEKADSTWNSVNESAKDVDLAAPGDSLSLPDPVVTSTPLDAIAEKHPVATSGPVQVVASENTGNDVRDAIFIRHIRADAAEMARSVEERSIDVPHEHSANLQSFPQLATEMVRVPESEITSPTLVAIGREHIGNDDRESTSLPEFPIIL